MQVLFSNIFEFLVYTIIPFIVLLGILILAHEFGHFITAKLSGVKVEIFALGFGPWIFHKQIGETDFGVKAIPLGGFVKVLGDPSEMEDPEKEIPPEDMDRALFKKPVWKKLIFFAAGSFMNIVLAFVAAPFVYLIGIERSYYNDIAPCNVGYVEPASPADMAGIKSGDRINRVNGNSVENFADLRTLEAQNPEEVLTYELLRGNTIFKADIKMAVGDREPIGYSGIMEPMYGTTVGSILPDFPASKAGLEPMDKIVAVNGKPVSHWYKMTSIIQAANGETIDITVMRQDREKTFKLKPKYDDRYDKYMIGIGPYDHPVMVRYPVIQALKAGFKDVIYWTGMTLVIVKKLFTLELSWRAVSGPAGIAGITGAAAHLGLSHLIWLLALISLNLAILNMLPVPPLDGAHFLITSIEGIIRREMKMKWKEFIFRAGFALLIALILLVTINDIIRFKGPILEWFKEIAKGLGLI
jgi:regulator of sigma E protease